MTRRSRVLLVDDRDDIRNMLRSTLTGFDCVFTEAEDGARALELIESNVFDVIVLDLKLRDMSGLDILKEARRRHLALGKVIVLTGYPGLDSAKEADELGAFRYLSKGSMSWSGIRRAFQDAIGIAPTAVAPTGMRASRGQKRPSVPSESRPPLLLVDSDPSSLEQMLDILSEEFEPIAATDADDAFRKFARHPPALAVVDVNLAGHVSGLDLLMRLRKRVPDLRAIMISDENDPDAVFESARRGALKYILKNRLTSLPALINSILNDRRPATKVFLCYARADFAAVSRLHSRLMKKGFYPWMDEKSLRVGSEWEVEIERAIKDSHYFVFLVSRNSVGREGVMRREVKLALRRQDEKVDGATFFIPARLEDCPREPSLHRFHHVDIFKRNGFAALLDALSPPKVPRAG